MLIRRNTKEFKAIKNLVEYFSIDEDREKKIKIFTVKSGHSIDDRIELEGDNAIFYDMSLETVLNNLSNENMQLQRSEDQEGLYFFHSSNNKNWDESPFQLSDALLKRLKEFENMPVRKTEKSKTLSGNKSASRTLTNHNSSGNKKSKTTTLIETTPITEKQNLVSPNPLKKNIPALRTKEKGKIEGSNKAKNIIAEKSAIEEATFPKPDKTKVIPLKKIVPAKPENPYQLKNPISFSNVEKIVFPDLSIHKKDILDYYNRMSPYLLPYLSKRFIHLKWHRGTIKKSIESKSLYELKEEWKGDLPAWVQTGTSDTSDHTTDRQIFLCPDKEHLLLLIEIGCVEINRWHSKVNSLEFPDFVVVELDSLNSDFSSLVEVALTAKRILDGLKIPAFVATSGNNGLHIYIPLDGKSTYETSKYFCEFICRLIHLKLSGITSLEIDRGVKKNKVYLNFSQNIYGKSTVAPYSLRPNAWGGVATPLHWNELDAKLDATSFNYKTIYKRINSISDPFQNFQKTGVNAQKTLVVLKETYGFLV